ncbi:pre-mRNA-splicing factor ISY1 [Fomitopsis serialis]|uniref:pre-mRNA-splicing factor ISY1 n=1 Tax=Fomitopsis serialis TaxID=139415 RepID=UPI002008E2B4|nr:pre-mRNA-splicing factor ISY1 [Neoantrodia serialis]KAH9932892.1 pre-mRNA-splicing factor ISY1 [Neoantrodia serialis]
MARNEEKAQSMLYRFREAQAAELGLGTRADRRPRMASACKSLRECERWRGEILREISRKVSKIQDAGLTDYEVRDLNDEINKLMREKRHWENQIVALGGANYRRNVAMVDDDGKEVPGTKGYKYFGRAKELPGVKELFTSKKKEEDEENQAQSYYKKFTNQGPSYFGDLDEQDGNLLEYEMHAEEEEWEDAYQHLRTVLGLSADEPIPKIPRSTTPSDTKRKAPDEDVEMAANGDADEPAKRARTDGQAQEGADASAVDPREAAAAFARATAAFIPFLSQEELLPPKMPTREEMETFLLGLRKKALVEEYFG